MNGPPPSPKPVIANGSSASQQPDRGSGAVTNGPTASRRAGTATSAEVVHEIERVLGEAAASDGAGRLVLAFDADGTLWSGDIGNDTFEMMLRGRSIREDAAAALRAEAERVGVARMDEANAQALLLYEAFVAGRYDAGSACAMMAWAFAGHRFEDYLAWANRAVREARLAARLHDEAHAILAYAREAGLPVYVVSGSPEPIVVEAVRGLSLDVAGVVGVSPEVVNGVILPRARQPVCFGAGKLLALREREPGARLLAAFSDSPHDLPMLREALVPVAVRPSRELVEFAAREALSERLLVLAS